MRKKVKKASLACMLLVLAILGTACGNKAATIKLERTEGKLLVRNAKSKEVDASPGMKLYNGYQMDTDRDSYAWIVLDDTKCAKMDQDSEIEIQSSGKKLEILLNAGSLYFNVEKPLEDDESMNIRTSTMAVGIRGTCGWMEAPDPNHMRVYILDGKVECRITDEESGEEETALVSAGEAAMMNISEGQMAITVDPFDQSQIPDFVMEEEPAISMVSFVPWRDAGLEDHVMEWGDAGLEKGVRRRTLIEEGDIMLSDVWEITDFGNTLQGQGIKDISALGELTNIRYLYLNNNQISSVTVLENLKNLENLILEGNQIQDISALRGLKHLYQLILDDNQIEDLSALDGMAKLTRLSLANNRIQDISALENVPKLFYLNLDNNQIGDISALAQLTGLDTLHLKNNRIHDISALEGMGNLYTLTLDENGITDISVLGTLEHLTTLSLDGNNITDYSPVSHLLPD